MTQLLIRLFIRRPNSPQDPRIRAAYGNLASVVGMVCNILLCLGKFVVGTLFGSIAITADALNNLSDASSNIVSLVGFKLAAKAPDAEHPYGHARFEYLAGLVVSVTILGIGFSLLKESVTKVLHPTPVQFGWLTVAVLVVSILVKPRKEKLAHRPHDFGKMLRCFPVNVVFNVNILIQQSAERAGRSDENFRLLLGLNQNIKADFLHRTGGRQRADFAGTGGKQGNFPLLAGLDKDAELAGEDKQNAETVIVTAVEKIAALIGWLKDVKAELARPQPPTLNDLLALHCANRNKGAYSNKAKNANLQRYAEAFSFLQSKNLYTVDDLESTLHAMRGKIDTMKKSASAKQVRIKELDELLRMMDYYKSGKPAADKLKSIRFEKSRQKYKDEHDDELRTFYMAERKLKPYFKDGKLPITAWRREREQLEQEYRDIQTELSPLHADVKKLWAIHYNIYEVQHEQERQNAATRQKKQEIEH